MILDTNGLSALTEGESRLEAILRKTTQIAVPVIALSEYRTGVQQSRGNATNTGLSNTVQSFAC
jgi:predicted nucleic acid-binding protein